MAKTDFGKKSKDAAAPALELAGRVEEHPQIRRDLADYVRGVFTIAGEALGLDQRRKEERGGPTRWPDAVRSFGVSGRVENLTDFNYAPSSQR